MGLSAGFVALGSTAPVLPSFEPCPNLGSREIGRLLVPAARPYGRLPAGDSAAVRKGVPLHEEPQTRIGYHAPALAHCFRGGSREYGARSIHAADVSHPCETSARSAIDEPPFGRLSSTRSG